MKQIAIILISALISALGFRVRGGFLSIKSHLLARLAWAIPVGACATVASGNVKALVIIPFLFAACTLPTFHAIDMGRNDGTLLQDSALMLLRGFAFSFAAAAPLFALGIVGAERTVAILGIGLFMPILFDLGWRTPSNVPHLERGSALGEAYFGAFYGLALTSALV